ncbi:YgcG family protein [Otariodibacter sp.]|uniref:TPM domain-containing protein n=1 Tax=Otariodibacter sp. TaxID=3030919 RepID=UPI00263A2673|nr:YgcG family protein [Otariodibacter sp.]
MIKRYYQLILSLALFSFSALSSAEYPSVPNPFRYVTDYTQTLSPQDQRTLENALVDYGTKTSSQIAVVIIASTEGETISSYTHNLFNKWGIGRKKENNGVLLLVAKNDHKLFIATGRGLEGVLPDAIASSIIRNDITPYFKENRYAEGIAKGLSSIIAATQGEYQPLENQDENDPNDFLIFIFFAIIIFFVFGGFNRRNGVYISSGDLGRVIRHSRSSGFGHSSGGFGGGSSGGFGGGSTGGGGAGGSW